MNPTDLAPPISLPTGLHWGPTRHDPATLWITGPPGAGAAIIGRAVCSALTSAGLRVRLLDDEPDDGVGVDLAERARRAAAAAVALVDEGVVAVVVIDSRHVRDRELARLAHEACRLPFFEIFVNTSTEHRQDGPKGEHYEVPPLPDLVVFPGPVVAAVSSVMALF